MFKKTLLEDLKAGDLEDTVKSTFEIDAYYPKIDDKNIVVSFQVEDENPAYDLSRFIEFSHKTVLDTEVSPGPDANGYYIVFVEFTPNNLAAKIYKMLEAVSYLTNITDWTYKAYGKRGKISTE
jgi:hypothetical protein